MIRYLNFIIEVYYYLIDLMFIDAKIKIIMINYDSMMVTNYFNDYMEVAQDELLFSSVILW